MTDLGSVENCHGSSVARLGCGPEVQRCHGAIERQARLIDIPPFVRAITIGVFRTEENPARSRVKLSHAVEDFCDMTRTAPPVGRRCREHPKLIDLEEDRRLAVQRGQETCAGGDLVATGVMGQRRLEKDLVDDLARVVLARDAVRNAHDIQVRALVALGAIPPLHQRVDCTEAGTKQQNRLRTPGCRQHVIDQIPHNPSGTTKVPHSEIG